MPSWNRADGTSTFDQLLETLSGVSVSIMPRNAAKPTTLVPSSTMPGSRERRYGTLNGRAFGLPSASSAGC